jgi:alkaline phosphatase D
VNSNKRKLLTYAATSAASLSVPKSAWSQPKFKDNPFTLGVASGMPHHDSVVLWTRLALEGFFGSGIGKDAVTVQWELAHDDKFSRIVQKGQHQAVIELAHSVHVEVPNLEPDRWYFYRFMTGDFVSVAGRTRTLPLPDAQVNRLRIAYASCQRYDHGYFSAYKHMIKENLDFVLFLGDYIYEYPGDLNAVRIPSGGWVLNLDDYRKRYALHKSEPELQAMHAYCPWIVSWDDHEVQNDYAGLVLGTGGPAVNDFAARRASAYQAFYEHMPLRSSVLTKSLDGMKTGAQMRIYSALQYGQLASIALLDTRQYRNQQACTRGGLAGSSTLDPKTCDIWNDPSRSILGSEQEAWLAKVAATQTAPWNIVAQTTSFGQRDHRKGSGVTLWNDGWDGYAPSRDRVRDSMSLNRHSMPVFLGGDIHSNWVGHIKADYAKNTSANVGVEFCGTSITARESASANSAELLAENPNYVFVDHKTRGYGVVEFTPKQLTATLRGLDDVRLKDTKVSNLAIFTVEAGKPLLQQS